MICFLVCGVIWIPIFENILMRIFQLNSLTGTVLVCFNFRRDSMDYVEILSY